MTQHRLGQNVMPSSLPPLKSTAAATTITNIERKINSVGFINVHQRKNICNPAKFRYIDLADGNRFPKNNHRNPRTKHINWIPNVWKNQLIANDGCKIIVNIDRRKERKENANSKKFLSESPKNTSISRSLPKGYQRPKPTCNRATDRRHPLRRRR